MSAAFPENDTTKTDSEQGLYNKFEVKRVDGKYPDHAYFVLDMDKDPCAKPALHAYATACFNTHPELANDIFRFLRGVY